jgi:hypothetical protein
LKDKIGSIAVDLWQQFLGWQLVTQHHRMSPMEQLLVINMCLIHCMLRGVQDVPFHDIYHHAAARGVEIKRRPVSPGPDLFVTLTHCWHHTL